MKPVIFVLFILFPLSVTAQNNFCDSVFIQASSDFITEFSVPDTMAIATEKKLEDYLKKFDEQFNCKFFCQNAKPLRALTYTSRFVNFGVVELAFKAKEMATIAYQYFLKKRFRDSWGLSDMLSCSMVDNEKVLFIYSCDVESPSMIDFVKQICNMQHSQ